MNKKKVYVIVLLGGNGLRFGTPKPKQLIEVKGRPLFHYTMDRLISSPAVDKILIVSSSDTIEELKESLKSLKTDRIIGVIPGGASREYSSYEGVKYIDSIEPDKESIVVVHDGDRPTFSERTLQGVIEAATCCGAAIPAVSSINAVAVSDDGEYIDHYANRDLVFQVQTPEAFKLGLLKETFDKGASHLDDYVEEGMSCLAISGIRSKIIEGDRDNIKITFPKDLEEFERKLK